MTLNCLINENTNQYFVLERNGFEVFSHMTDLLDYLDRKYGISNYQLRFAKTCLDSVSMPCRP